MTICKFWSQGNCKFGNSCRFEHPNGGNRNQGGNRFGALGGSNGGAGQGSQNKLDKYKISIDTIEADLTTDTPQWLLSAYAPGRDAPDQLFGGYPREQSFEEMRMHYLTGKAEGKEQEALNQAQELYQNAQQQMQTALSNIRDAANFVADAEDKHPNRHDICQQGTQGQPFGEFLVGKRPKSSVPDASAPTNPFAAGGGPQPSAFGGGNTAAASGSAFGQPSALGQKPNPFGQTSSNTPAFGQPSQPSSTFGQASQASQPANPFGQPSQPQQTSAFGQPSQPGSGFAKPTFGQASQPAASGSAFGQPSQLGAKPSAFGTPSFGQPSQPTAQGSVFGQPSQSNAQSSAFGQPSQLGQKPNPFGSTSDANSTASPFGSTSNASGNSNTANPFGQPSTSQGNAAASPFASASSGGQPQAGSSAFGQPSQSSGAFGQNLAAANPFGSSDKAPAQAAAANPFGQTPATAQAANPFGSSQQQPSQQSSGAFGQQSGANNPFASNNANNASTAGSFGQSGQAKPVGTAPAATSNNPYPPDSTRTHPPIESYSAITNGSLSTFQDKPVAYKDGKPGIRQFDGTWQRIWFPTGPPAYNKDTALPPEEYDEKTKAQWETFAQTGNFADGIMPELPPPRDCTLWNF